MSTDKKPPRLKAICTCDQQDSVTFCPNCQAYLLGVLDERERLTGTCCEPGVDLKGMMQKFRREGWDAARKEMDISVAGVLTSLEYEYENFEDVKWD